jgi:hypothetical protein
VTGTSTATANAGAGGAGVANLQATTGINSGTLGGISIAAHVGSVTISP